MAPSWSTESVELSHVAGALSVVAIAGICRFLWKSYRVRSMFKKLEADGLPMMKHHWLWGHLPILFDYSKSCPPDTNPARMMLFLRDNAAKYFPDHDTAPPVIYVDSWPVGYPAMMVIDADMTSQFTVEPSLPKHDMYAELAGCLGDMKDIACSNGEQWKYWRSRFNPGFSFKALSELIPEIVDETVIFARRMAEIAGSKNEGDGWGKLFKFQILTTDLTFDIIGRAILDMRLDEQSGKMSRFRQALMRSKDYMTVDFDPLNMIIPINFVRAFRLWRNNKIMRDELMVNINHRLALAERDAVEKRTIVDMALDSAKMEGTAGKAKGGGYQFNEVFLNDLIQNLKMFMFAGHDTTADTLCFAVWRLIKNPHCLEKLVSEVDTLFGQPANGDYGDAEKLLQQIREDPSLLNRLPYLTACIKESLRLHPPGFTIRKSPPGHTLHHPSYSPFPSHGFMMWDAFIAIQSSPELWPQHYDFIPERFIVEEGHPLRPHKTAWRAFSVGNRNCIGQELAWFEIKMAMVVIARGFEIKFDWESWDKENPGAKREVVDGDRLYATGSATPHPKNGMPVRIRQRQ